MRNLKLAHKLSVVVVGIMLAILVVVGISAARDINAMASTVLEVNQRAQAALVEDLIVQLEGEALQVATVLAELEQVKAAYRERDEARGRTQLDRGSEVNGGISEISQQSHQNRELVAVVKHESGRFKV